VVVRWHPTVIADRRCDAKAADPLENVYGQIIS
jgi:hypothetical protein